MSDGYWLDRYECPRPACGKHHKNGSKAQARCEATQRGREAALTQALLALAADKEGGVP